jgi:hypothetical protein
MSSDPSFQYTHASVRVSDYMRCVLARDERGRAKSRSAADPVKVCYPFGPRDRRCRAPRPLRSNVRVFPEGHTLHVLTREERVSDTREPSYPYIDRVIWAVLVIAIIGIGWLIISNL